VAADGLDNLFAVIAYRAEEYPALKTVEAAPSLLLVLWVLIYTDGALPLR
jgi:hypothetical protein